MTSGYTLFHMRCMSCNKILGGMQRPYEEMLAAGISPGEAMDRLGLERYCCRVNVMTPMIIPATFLPEDPSLPQAVRDYHAQITRPPQIAESTNALSAMQNYTGLTSIIQLGIDDVKQSTVVASNIKMPVLNMPSLNMQKIEGINTNNTVAPNAVTNITINPVEIDIDISTLSLTPNKFTWRADMRQLEITDKIQSILRSRISGLHTDMSRITQLTEKAYDALEIWLLRMITVKSFSSSGIPFSSPGTPFSSNNLGKKIKPWTTVYTEIPISDSINQDFVQALTDLGIVKVGIDKVHFLHDLLGAVRNGIKDKPQESPLDDQEKNELLLRFGGLSKYLVDKIGFTKTLAITLRYAILLPRKIQSLMVSPSHFDTLYQTFQTSNIAFAYPEMLEYLNIFNPKKNLNLFSWFGTSENRNRDLESQETRRIKSKYGKSKYGIEFEDTDLTPEELEDMNIELSRLEERNIGLDSYLDFKGNFFDQDMLEFQGNWLIIPPPVIEAVDRVVRNVLLAAYQATNSKEPVPFLALMLLPELINGKEPIFYEQIKQSEYLRAYQNLPKKVYYMFDMINARPIAGSSDGIYALISNLEIEGDLLEILSGIAISESPMFKEKIMTIQSDLGNEGMPVGEGMPRNEIVPRNEGMPITNDDEDWMSGEVVKIGVPRLTRREQELQSIESARKKFAGKGRVYLAR